MISRIGTISSDSKILGGRGGLIVYEVITPSISTTIPIEAYVLSQPGVYTEYKKGDQVLIFEGDDGAIILGLFQRALVSGSISSMSVGNMIVANGELSLKVNLAGKGNINQLIERIEILENKLNKLNLNNF